MSALVNSRRLTPLTLFVLFTFPILTLIGLSVPYLGWLWLVDTTVRSVPLCLSIGIDAAFFDGGELSPELIPLWVALTGALLWPLLTLGIRPVLWASRRWRQTILAYATVATACTVVASAWIFTHTGYLF